MWVQQVQRIPSSKQTIPHQNQQILIKVAACKNRTRRYGFAFEATTMDENILFKGGANSGRQSIYVATQEALVEAIFKAKDLGLYRILILCNHKKLVKICNFPSKPSWQDQALLSDLHQLKLQSLCIFVLFAPRLIISHVFNIATRATNCPGHFVYEPSLV